MLGADENSVEINNLPIFSISYCYKTYEYRRKRDKLSEWLFNDKLVPATSLTDAILRCQRGYCESWYREWCFLSCEPFTVDTPLGRITTLVHGDSVYQSLPSNAPLELVTYKVKRLARSMVTMAVNMRVIEKTQVCCSCGETIPENKEPKGNRIEAHHVDYRRPLEVVWMCRSCHMRMHASIPAFWNKRSENASD